MTNLFLVPTSRKRARDNIARTVLQPVHPADLSGLGAPARKVARSHGDLWAWGTMPGKADVNVSTWSAMERGDWVLFYSQGVFTFAGRVLLREHSAAVARRLWGEEAGQTWEYLYLLDEVRRVEIPRQLALKSLGYGQRFYPIKFSRVKRNLEKAHGSVEHLLEGLSSVGADLQVAFDAARTGDEVAAATAIDRLEREISQKELQDALKRYAASAPPEERKVVGKRLKRSGALVRKLKRLYEGRCQYCGFTFAKADGKPYSEAAHIDPISGRKANLDVKDNLLVLCANHHKMLDYGALEVEFDAKKKKLYGTVGGKRKAMTNLHVE